MPVACCDVPAAGLGVAHGQIGSRLRRSARTGRRRRPWRSCTSPLEPVGAGDAAAVGVALDDPQLGHEREQLQRRLADAVALLLAGRVVGDGLGERREVRLELAALVHGEQVLADVVHAVGDIRSAAIVAHAEDLQRLALEHQRAARRGADDVHALARIRREPLGQLVDVACARRRRARWTAAAARSSPAWAPRRRCRCARAARRSSRPAAARSSSSRSRGSRRLAPLRGGARLVRLRPTLERAAGEAAAAPRRGAGRASARRPVAAGGWRGSSSPAVPRASRGVRRASGARSGGRAATRRWSRRTWPWPAC